MTHVTPLTPVPRTFKPPHAQDRRQPNPRLEGPWQPPLTFLITTLLLLSACASRHPIPAMNPQSSINSTLNTFHAAASQSDFARYFATWTEQSVFLGTDATERWEGKQFKDFAKPYFDKGQGWTYLPRDRHISLSKDGATAWFDELLDHEKYGECRGTGVLLRAPSSESSGGGWTIVQYNLSYPIPNDLAAEVTTRVKKWKADRK